MSRSHEYVKMAQNIKLYSLPEKAWRRRCNNNKGRCNGIGIPNQDYPSFKTVGWHTLCKIIGQYARSIGPAKKEVLAETTAGMQEGEVLKNAYISGVSKKVVCHEKKHLFGWRGDRTGSS
jgi:hypothetical protein